MGSWSMGVGGIHHIEIWVPSLDRTAAGMNHLVIIGGSRSDVDAVTKSAADNGSTPLFADRHPHAGGPDDYSSHMENSDGLEVEVVAVNEQDGYRTYIRK